MGLAPKTNWAGRLDVCTLQLALAIRADQPDSIESWVKKGYEAIAECERIIDTKEDITPKEIAHINSKISKFKTNLKND